MRYLFFIFAFILELGTDLPMRSYSLADEAALVMEVTGEIKPYPAWEDESTNVIGTVIFSFDKNFASRDPSKDLVSQEVSLRLVNAASYPASVELVRPTKCKIGDKTINNNHVHLLQNGVAHTQDSNLALSSNQLHKFAIKFAGAGKYGNLSGKVSCNAAGAMTYSY